MNLAASYGRAGSEMLDMVFCSDAVKKILYEGVDIKQELDEKEYYLKMLYAEPQIQKKARDGWP